MLFHILWKSYPTEIRPCKDPHNYLNQCAIRMSITLQSSGFQLMGYNQPQCSHGHARGAEELANYLTWRLKWRMGANVIKIKNLNSSEARKAVYMKTGIIFFKDIANFREGTGDHIDLWNLTQTKTGEYFDLCKEVWFWPIA